MIRYDFFTKALIKKTMADPTSMRPIPTTMKKINPQDIDINDYTYPLPEERIAKFPLAERDASQLLIYKGGDIGHTRFRQLPEQLPEGALLLFNNTRVIHARLPFRRATGARIEIFCLEPLDPAGHLQSLTSEGPVTWKCLIGNNKRWKEPELVLPIDTPQGTVRLFAERLGPAEDAFRVRFRWDKAGMTFGELLHEAGLIPLPPYLHRDETPEDERRYQTVYARHDGSVAAPTAGLHFTEEVLQQLREKDIRIRFVTLHVGAGTFRPVKTERLQEHHMHEEQLVVSRSVLRDLWAAVREGRPIIPVGTTSLRTLESLYWQFAARDSQLALKVDSNDKSFQLDVDQWAPYESKAALPAEQALQKLLEAMDRHEQEELRGQTGLLIAPGYRFRLASGLITNFHQPRSTLLLLIAAMIGEDWKKVYRYALDHDFRFLSYGDSSLLLP